MNEVLKYFEKCHKEQTSKYIEAFFWYFLQRAQNVLYVFCLVAFSYEQTLTEFEMSWIERRVISFFLKISGLRWLFSIIGVRTQQVLQKLDKVDVF